LWPFTSSQVIRGETRKRPTTGARRFSNGEQRLGYGVAQDAAVLSTF
jgi:hypothetical protein